MGFCFSAATFCFERRKQIEIAGDEARGAGARAVLLAPGRGAFDQGRMEAQPEVVVAGQIDAILPADADGPCIDGLDRREGAAQAIPVARIEKGLVAAFACCTPELG